MFGREYQSARNRYNARYRAVMLGSVVPAAASSVDFLGWRWQRRCYGANNGYSRARGDGVDVTSRKKWSNCAGRVQYYDKSESETSNSHLNQLHYTR